MLNAFIAALGYTGGIISDKIVLGRHKVPLLRFIPLLFIFLALFSATLLLKYGRVDWQVLLTSRYLLLTVLMTVVAVTWNIYYYRGLQQEDIHEFELIMLLSPLATILFAELFIPSERSWPTFVAGFIASVALIATRFRHHHAKISRVAWQSMLAMLLMSLESIIVKELLQVLSPVALYFARTAILALVFSLVYRPKILEMPKSAFFLTLLSAIFGVIQMVLKFYGFESLGVIETTMILVLGPFMVYFISVFMFKEKAFKRDIFAFVVLVICILYVTLGKNTLGLH